MARIPEYKQRLIAEGSLSLFREMPLTVLGPDPDDPDAGPGLDEMEIDAAEAVELQRALTAWLEVHAITHPAWHRRYRANNPGGPWLTQAQISRQVQRLTAAEDAITVAVRNLKRI